MLVSENKLKIGLGTASLVDIPEIDAVNVIITAYEKGIRYFDTSPFYGNGLAEHYLGIALKHLGDDVVVSTKCGHYRDSGGGLAHSKKGVWFDFSEQTIRQSIEKSCTRLGRNFLDVLFLHDLEGSPEQAFSEGLPVLQDLRSKGRVGHIGAGCNTVAGLLSAVDNGACDWLLVAGRWTILDRSAGAKLLTRAHSVSSHIVVGGVLNSGCIGNPDDPEATFDYRPILPDERSAAQVIKSVADAYGVHLLAAALQFPSQDKRVSTLLLGAASVDQLNGSIKALSAPIPDIFWEKIDHMGLKP